MTTDADSEADSVLLDTNVLLSATIPARKLHSAALKVLNEWPTRDIELCVSGQVLREYLVVATRRPEHNGLGLSIPDALANVEAFAVRTRFLTEGPAVADRLRELVEAKTISGKQIHDANLVATALAQGIPSLVTANIADFRRFEDQIDILPLG